MKRLWLRFVRWWAWSVSGFALVLSARGETTTAGRYSGGECDLAVMAAEQFPWPVGHDEWSVRLQMQLRLAKPEPGANPKISLPLPENFYLNNQKSPLLAAYLPGKKKNLASEPHLGVTSGRGLVLIANVHFTSPQPRLERVACEMELVKITEWETLTFRVASGENRVFRCGPFELNVTGEPTRLNIDAAAYPEFASDHEKYRRRLPLAHFLKAGYVEEALKVVDATGSAISGQGWSTTMPSNWKEGVTSITFRGWGNPVTGVGSGGGRISYPVSISLRMPKRYETEKIRFHFERIDLPLPN